MTTAAAKLTALAKGHGLTGRITEQAYQQLAAGTEPESIVCLAILQPVGHGELKNKRHVNYEPVAFEPVTDVDDAATYRQRIETMSNDRHGYLPLDFTTRPEDEQTKALIERIEAWADENDLSGADVDEKWRDLLGSGDNAAGTYEKGSAQHLLQFAHSVGAVPAPVEPADGEPTLDDLDSSDEQ